MHSLALPLPWATTEKVNGWLPDSSPQNDTGPTAETRVSPVSGARRGTMLELFQKLRHAIRQEYYHGPTA